MDQILVTIKYQSVPVPGDIIEAISETDSSDNKIQVNHFNNDHSIVQDDHYNNNNDDNQTHLNDEDNFEDESYYKLNSLQQLNGKESKKIFNQENQILSIVGSSKSISVYVNHTRTTRTSTFLQGLFLQYLHKTVNTILCLQPSIGICTQRYSMSSLRMHLYGCTPTSISTRISKE